jgi:hypothetical protein
MARQKSAPSIYVATESGSAEVDGENMTFVKGVTRVRAGHRLLEQLPAFFEPADEDLSYDVEDAAAGPDVKRDAVVVGTPAPVAAVAPAAPVAPVEKLAAPVEAVVPAFASGGVVPADKK